MNLRDYNIKHLLFMMLLTIPSLSAGTPGEEPPSLLSLQKNIGIFKTTYENEKVQIAVTNLNTAINSWFLVIVRSLNPEVKEPIFEVHLENPFKDQYVVFERSFEEGIILRRHANEYKCTLWKNGDISELKKASKVTRPFASICGDRLYVRNKIRGYHSTKEWVTQFLRDRVWGGDAITTLVKNTIFKDMFLIESKKGGSGATKEPSENAPFDGLIEESYKNQIVTTEEFGLTLEPNEQNMNMGAWYPVKDEEGMFASAIIAKAVEESILSSHKDRVLPLEQVESEAVSYLVAFDLSRFEVGYTLGTEHPRLSWSKRVPEEVIKEGWSGPDGFDTIEPLIRTGLLNPAHTKRLAAIFTAGFKRHHGAFRFGELSRINGASHYGFLEKGVLLSKMHPGLGTLIVSNSGKLELRTWQETDNIEGIRYARQNGVPLIERSQDGSGIPSKYANSYELGNWSGSAKAERRTLRSGICVTSANGRQFLVYGYFSSVTVSSMVRIFQAYQCDYAIHLDMNALEHTYLARYLSEKDSNILTPEQIVKGMEVFDTRRKGVPRFVGYPDNRDFFYLLRK